MWLNQNTHLHTSIIPSITIHKKSTKILLSLIVPSVVILSLQKDSMQKKHGLCKNMRGNKKGQVPGTSKKKEKKSETRVKMDKCPE